MITLNQSYTYEELLRNLQESVAQYPDFTVYKEVGESHDERSIPMLRVGLGLDALILTAGIHGKESINPVLLTRMAQEYSQAYQDNLNMGNYPVRELLDYCSICFLPMIDTVSTSSPARRNRSTTVSPSISSNPSARNTHTSFIILSILSFS